MDHSELLKLLELLLPRGFVRIVDKARSTQRLFPVITEGTVLAKTFEAELVPLTFHPLRELLVGWVRVWDEHVSMFLLEL
jgi:hypothetical protein